MKMLFLFPFIGVESFFPTSNDRIGLSSTRKVCAPVVKGFYLESANAILGIVNLNGKACFGDICGVSLICRLYLPELLHNPICIYLYICIWLYTLCIYIVAWSYDILSSLFLLLCFETPSCVIGYMFVVPLRQYLLDQLAMIGRNLPVQTSRSVMDSKK